MEILHLFLPFLRSCLFALITPGGLPLSQFFVPFPFAHLNLQKSDCLSSLRKKEEARNASFSLRSDPSGMDSFSTTQLPPHHHSSSISQEGYNLPLPLFLLLLLTPWYFFQRSSSSSRSVPLWWGGEGSSFSISLRATTISSASPPPPPPPPPV